MSLGICSGRITSWVTAPARSAYSTQTAPATAAARPPRLKPTWGALDNGERQRVSEGFGGCIGCIVLTCFNQLKQHFEPLKSMKCPNRNRMTRHEMGRHPFFAMKKPDLAGHWEESLQTWQRDRDSILGVLRAALLFQWPSSSLFLPAPC